MCHTQSAYGGKSYMRNTRNGFSAFASSAAGLGGRVQKSRDGRSHGHRYPFPNNREAQEEFPEDDHRNHGEAPKLRSWLRWLSAPDAPLLFSVNETHTAEREADNTLQECIHQDSP
jgi:hypothetical protein